MLGPHCNFSCVITVVVDQCRNYLQRLGVPLSELSHCTDPAKGIQEGLLFQGKTCHRSNVQECSGNTFSGSSGESTGYLPLRAVISTAPNSSFRKELWCCSGSCWRSSHPSTASAELLGWAGSLGRDICAPCPCLASPPASRKCHRQSYSHQNYRHLNSFLEIVWAQPPEEMRWHRTD